VSPTIFRYGPYRFHFFSREESRMHVHVYSSDGEAKIWMEPRIQLAKSAGMSRTQLREAVRLATEHEDEIRNAWEEHFGD
jgi:hypothetical protein